MARQTRRQCEHMSVSEHFVQWTAAGMVLRNLEELRLVVESPQSAGASIQLLVTDACR